jgi:Protein of unknown function (DUF3093)
VTERPAEATPYTERLRCPWWLWLPVAALAAILALEVGLGAPGVRTWLPLGLALALVCGGVWWLGRIPITVTDSELLVDDARLPHDVIADVIPLDAAQKRLLLGPAADPLAFVIQRPWIGGAVQIVLDDPQDPTPYWVISSRHPEALAAALPARSRSAA